MKNHELLCINNFFAQKDDSGVTNAAKASYPIQYDLSKPEMSPGIVLDKEKRFVGLGINIKNESVYPIESFELFLREKNFCGTLDISNCSDLVFLDLYRNNISKAIIHGLSSMRILGLQDNNLTELDPRELPVCQGIDIGKNKISEIDVSKNLELVEFYIHFNNFSMVDLSKNKKLKYFWCNNNKISYLDVRENILLKHLDCNNNPLLEVKACAPNSEGKKPLSLKSNGNGFVGLKFCPVYNEKWKETGEWQQIYSASPCDGYKFDAWTDLENNVLSKEQIWIDSYGSSKELIAKFVTL